MGKGLSSRSLNRSPSIKMTEFESLVKILATTLGIITLFAPILFLLRQSHRPKGRAAGKVAASRTWIGVFMVTVSFIGLGVVLWKPFPLDVSKGDHIGSPLLFLFTIIGAIAYFPGISLYVWGLITLRSQFGVSGLLGAELYREHELITKGPFALMRHPMYVGVLLTAIGALFIFRTWAMVVFTPMSLVVIARAEREEKLLAQEFGDEWQSYASKVPKWLLRL
jgi:protein-S-isoprenylcysteine O-methyltransferase Ste14